MQSHRITTDLNPGEVTCEDSQSFCAVYRKFVNIPKKLQIDCQMYYLSLYDNFNDYVRVHYFPYIPDVVSLIY